MYQGEIRPQLMSYAFLLKRKQKVTIRTYKIKKRKTCPTLVRDSTKLGLGEIWSSCVGSRLLIRFALRDTFLEIYARIKLLRISFWISV